MKQITTLLLLAICSLSSCYHVYYSPNTPNAPLLSKKGETRINALYTTGESSDFNGGELQFAHALSNHFGLLINGFVAGKTEEVSDYFTNNSHTEKGNGSYIELGGGAFKSFDARKKWIGEIYAGAGFGSVKNEYGSGDQSKVNCTKFFVQPAIGYKSKNFEAVIIPKISLVNLRVKEANINSQENAAIKDDLSVISQQKSFVAFEPALVLRGGAENVKIQLALSASRFKSDSYASDLTENSIASIGISININPRKK